MRREALLVFLGRGLSKERNVRLREESIFFRKGCPKGRRARALSRVS